VLLLAGSPSPPLFPAPSQQKVPHSAIEESPWSGSEKVGGTGEKKQGNIYKIFSYSEILFTIKGQALADCSNDQKGYLISVINSSLFQFLTYSFKTDVFHVFMAKDITPKRH